MASIVTPYTALHALIVDDMAVQQTTLRGQLASLGIGKVDAVGNADDAIRQIRAKHFQLILCDYNLGGRTDGQQLLEHLREEDLLPADCLFFMITAEGSYASVAAATEHKPDAYLLKPITAADIGDRLRQLLDRRQALLQVTSRLHKHDLEGAVMACDELLAKRDRWTMHLLQLKGQTLLALGRPDDAKSVYRQALDLRADLVWAQLGLARAHKAAGQYEQAKSLAQDLIQSTQGQKHVAAYDVLAESMEALGDAVGALWVLKDAAEVVPSGRRHRLVGESAYRNGDLETAKESLQRVTRLTGQSVMAQTHDHLMLAQTLVDRGEHAEALKVLAAPAFSSRIGAAAQDPATHAIRAQAQAASGDAAAAEASLARARDALRKPKADLATVALARAELSTGHEHAGLALLQQAVSADHENPRLRQLIGKALTDTGHADKLQSVIEAAAAELELRVKEAKRLFRDSRIDEALSTIEAAVHDYPENTSVLLQAAQMNCLALRLLKRHDAQVIEHVDLYLGRLHKLMPGHDRVTQMQRYVRETMEQLQSPQRAAA
jgi:CheY-like chemotaxis protein/Flp pilus assembly protein TadD